MSYCIPPAKATKDIALICKHDLSVSGGELCYNFNNFNSQKDEISLYKTLTFFFGMVIIIIMCFCCCRIRVIKYSQELNTISSTNSDAASHTTLLLNNDKENR